MNDQEWSRLTSTSRSFCFTNFSTPFVLQFPTLNPLLKSRFSCKSPCSIKLKLGLATPRATSEGPPSELVDDEDSKFVPLEAEAPTCKALLLLGFEVEEAAKVQAFLKELDGEFLEVIFCTENMLHRTMWEAMNTKQPNLDASKIATSLPRICFFSGLSGEEMVMFIDDFPASGLEPPVFAALVPNSADKPLLEVIEEIMGDHEMMTSGEINQDEDAS